ncbi:tRNA 2-selenouridine synthase [Serratia fonticola]|uniref:tRNA 2-selenouridine synthase n=1 Tax=Serratia fonticola TaxID=47917 RepID=A0A4U9VBM1_SERFO|nr:tRNA 2-selenouridine synthase [Serratia fonticola]
MQQAALVVIDDPFDVRVARLQDEYIDRMRIAFEQVYGEQRRLAANMMNICTMACLPSAAAWGWKLFQQLTLRLESALQVQRLTGQSEAPSTMAGCRCCNTITTRCIATN